MGKEKNEKVPKFSKKQYIGDVLNDLKEHNDGQTHKSWVFRLCNYNDEEINFFKMLETSYTCFGREKCPTTGTPHLQGFIIFKRNYSFNALKKLQPRTTWFVAKCSDAMNYCIKEDINPFIKDSRVGQGKRTDLSIVAEAVRTHGIQYVTDNHADAYMKHAYGIEKYAQRCQKLRDFKPCVIWLHGATGTGKTMFVQKFHEPEHLWVSPSGDLKFWEYYENQDAVILDDFRRETCAFNTLLKYLHHLPCQVNIKGGSRQLNSRYMYVTCPLSPQKLFESNGEDIQQLIRRIDRIVCLTGLDKNQIDLLKSELQHFIGGFFDKVDYILKLKIDLKKYYIPCIDYDYTKLLIKSRRFRNHKISDIVFQQNLTSFRLCMLKIKNEFESIKLRTFGRYNYIL